MSPKRIFDPQLGVRRYRGLCTLLHTILYRGPERPGIGIYRGPGPNPPRANYIKVEGSQNLSLAF